MYVKDGKRTYRHIFYHTFLNMVLFECNAIYVKDVEDRSNTPKGCDAMYVKDVKDVKDRSNTPKGSDAMYVEDVKDVKDRSNTPKGCNAMYVKDVEDGKRTYTHILAHNFLNILQIFNPKKVLEILCMSKHVEDVEDYL